MEHKLSDRKKKVLRAVVDEYISSPIPVSSSEIQEKYFNDISSATIRVELSALEEMGYLVQPHTSAGRVPSSIAYKFYVENFIGKKPLKKKEIKTIDNFFDKKFTEIEDIVKTSAKVISEITNYTSVIVINNINNVLVKEIKIVGLEPNSALVIIITDSGIIKDNVISLKKFTNPSFIRDANVLINKIFAGYTVGELKTRSQMIEIELSDFRELLDCVIEILKNYSNKSAKNVYVEGGNKMLNYPGATLEQAKSALNVLEDKLLLGNLLDDKTDNIEFSFRIGKDETCGIDRCAIMTAKYTINGKEVGQAGVIGPERMDYGKVMGVLSYLSKSINSIAACKLIDKGEEASVIGEEDDEEK
ncbi:MAG: Heat-inducible transcription repressor HrcA [Firmicutes bacterium ADurb.Bin080]|jgi:heat-inducible transcriptional repressor|nr:heat-inducible transcription repressor HrcA [Clostridiales bacterium]OQC12704.1 MAG: Heat-inducible transcription repressor HrcA [Firmicutes bacterium ADurb.Bin080]